MRIEIEPARTDDRHDAADGHRATGHASEPSGTGWSDEDVARLRSEWDAEPGHR